MGMERESVSKMTGSPTATLAAPLQHVNHHADHHRIDSHSLTIDRRAEEELLLLTARLSTDAPVHQRPRALRAVSVVVRHSESVQQAVSKQRGLVGQVGQVDLPPRQRQRLLLPRHLNASKGSRRSSSQRQCKVKERQCASPQLPSCSVSETRSRLRPEAPARRETPSSR